MSEYILSAKEAREQTNRWKTYKKCCSKFKYIPDCCFYAMQCIEEYIREGAEMIEFSNFSDVEDEKIFIEVFIELGYKVKKNGKVIQIRW